MELQTYSKPVAQQRKEKNRTKLQNSWAERLLTKQEADCQEVKRCAKSTAAFIEDCSTGVLSDSWGNVLGAELLSLRVQLLDGSWLMPSLPAVE